MTRKIHQSSKKQNISLRKHASWKIQDVPASSKQQNQSLRKHASWKRPRCPSFIRWWWWLAKIFSDPNMFPIDDEFQSWVILKKIINYIHTLTTYHKTSIQWVLRIINFLHDHSFNDISKFSAWIAKIGKEKLGSYIGKIKNRRKNMKKKIRVR